MAAKKATEVMENKEVMEQQTAPEVVEEPETKVVEEKKTMKQKLASKLRASADKLDSEQVEEVEEKPKKSVWKKVAVGVGLAGAAGLAVVKILSNKGSDDDVVDTEFEEISEESCDSEE